MSVRRITQHKWKVTNLYGRVLDYLWADSEDDALAKAQTKHGYDINLTPTHIKRTGKPTSERAQYKKEFYS